LQEPLDSIDVSQHHDGKAALNSNLGLSSVTPNKLSTYLSGVDDDFFNHSLSFGRKVSSQSRFVHSLFQVCHKDALSCPLDA
jgi:hypothetical protein